MVKNRVHQPRSLLQKGKYALLLLFMFQTVLHAEQPDCPPYCGPHITLFADPLYWTVAESIDWVVFLQQGEKSGSTKYKTLSFNWDHGVRVGAGYSHTCTAWDTRAYYTHYSTKTSSKTSAGAFGQLVPAFLGNRRASAGLFTFNYATGEVRWNLDFQAFDWDLRYTIAPSPAFLFRPSIGVKAASIKQRIHSYWQNPHLFIIFGLLDASENLKNDFIGIGPKGGFDLKWRLFHLPIYLFGDFSGAYLWGRWTIKDRYKNNRGERADVDLGRRRFGSFMIAAFAGLEYNHTLTNQASHLSLQLGYEVQDWFNQLQIFDNGTGGHTNDLMLQGLTGRVSFRF